MIMAFRWKQGLLIAPFLAALGWCVIFFYPLVMLWFPGVILAWLLDKIGFIHIGGREIIDYVIYCNPVMFGIIGFFIGAFIRSWKHVIYILLPISVLLLLGYITFLISRCDWLDWLRNIVD
jgi:hypothetical protein